MSYEEFQTESYRFVNFHQIGLNVIFEVVPIEGRDVTDDDRTKINEFLHELGKWENVVKAGLNLLSDLTVIQVEQSILQSYEKEFGIEKYAVNIEIASLRQRLTVITRLSREERHRREATETSPVFRVQEIYDQVKNIPKWRALQKAMNLTRRNLE